MTFMLFLHVVILLISAVVLAILVKTYLLVSSFFRDVNQKIMEMHGGSVTNIIQSNESTTTESTRTTASTSA